MKNIITVIRALIRTRERTFFGVSSSAKETNTLTIMFRNIGKVENGDIGRVPVACAQGINIFNEVSKYNKTFALKRKIIN